MSRFDKFDRFMNKAGWWFVAIAGIYFTVHVILFATRYWSVLK